MLTRESPDRHVKAPSGPEQTLVAKALNEYGPRFIDFGNPVWKTQANALRRASYMKPKETKSFVANY